MTSPDLSLLLASACGVDVESLVHRPAWQRKAACRGKPVELFFPERGESAGPAKAICAGCPVIEPCAQFSIGESHGIWAGTSGRGRQRMRREAA